MQFLISYIPIVIVVSIIVLPIFILIHAAKRRRLLNVAPVMNVSATIVSRRTEVGGGTWDGFDEVDGASAIPVFGYKETDCFATFKLDSGEAMELQVENTIYGLMAEGDAGKLTYQDKQFISFERDIL